MLLKSIRLENNLLSYKENNVKNISNHIVNICSCILKTLIHVLILSNTACNCLETVRFKDLFWLSSSTISNVVGFDLCSF